MKEVPLPNGLVRCIDGLEIALNSEMGTHPMSHANTSALNHTGGLSREEQDVCRLLGVSAQDFRDAKQSMPARHASASALNHTGGLTREEQDVCRMTGISTQDFNAATSTYQP